MTELHLSRQRAVIDAPFAYQAAAHAAADRAVEDGIASASAPGVSFSKRGDVGVIFHEDLASRNALHPFPEREFGPAGNVIRLCDAAGPPVHRAAVTDADGSWLPAIAKSTNGAFERLPDSFRATRG